MIPSRQKPKPVKAVQESLFDTPAAVFADHTPPQKPVKLPERRKINQSEIPEGYIIMTLNQNFKSPLHAKLSIQFDEDKTTVDIWPNEDGGYTMSVLTPEMKARKK